MSKHFVFLLLGAASLSCSRSAPVATTTPEPVAETAPQPLLYRPSTTHYRLAQHQSVTQEVQGTVNTTNIESSLRITSTIEPADSGLALRITIDSVEKMTGPTILPAQLKNLPGLEFTGIFDERGNVTSLSAPDTTNPIAEALAVSFTQFYPILPAGGLTDSVEWTDTTTANRRNAGTDIDVKSINHHTVTGWTQFGGARALELNTSSQLELKGTGSQSGVEFTFEGTGTSENTAYISETGLYLGRIGRDSINASAIISSLGMIIPITQLSHDTAGVVNQ